MSDEPFDDGDLVAWVRGIYPWLERLHESDQHRRGEKIMAAIDDLNNASRASATRSMRYGRGSTRRSAPRRPRRRHPDQLPSTMETVAEEVARLRREIAERQARLFSLVAGDRTLIHLLRDQQVRIEVPVLTAFEALILPSNGSLARGRVS